MATYQTPNGPRSLEQIQAELRAAGYGGPWDGASMLAAYNRTAAPNTASPNPYGDLTDFYNQIAAGNREKFEQQKQQFAQELYSTLAQNLLNTAAGLRGPRDYFKFQEYTGGGRNLFDQLYGSQARPAFSAPTQKLEPMTMADLLRQLGLMPPDTTPVTAPATTPPPAGSPAPAQPPAGAWGIFPQPGAAPATASRTVPLPYQIQPGVWDSLGPVGQQLTLGAAESQGWDPDEFLRQLNAARPRGIAPRQTDTRYAAPAAVF